MSNTRKLGIIIKVRMSSARLPGKVLMQINGRSCLEHLTSRLSRSRHKHKLVVATSVENEDDSIEEEANKLNVSCYRGSLNDVLGRLAGATKHYNFDHVVAIDGDKAMLDVEIVDFVINTFLEEYPKYDCVVNLKGFSNYTFPPGQVIYVYRAEALLQANTLALDDKAREHLYLTSFENKQIFKVKTIDAPEYWNRPDIRTAIDTPEDFEFNCRVFEELYPQNPYFSMKDIIGLINRKPELKNINSHISPRKMR